jgi:hypothetical protein
VCLFRERREAHAEQDASARLRSADHLAKGTTLMLDFTALDAGVEYRRDQFVHEAAHERLLRPLRPTTAQALAARATRRGRLGSLVVARTVLFLVLAAAGLSPFVASAPVSSAPLAAPVPAPLQPSMAVDQNAAGLGCWVTGELVWSPEGSTGNPAAVAQTVCGGR